MRGCLQAAAGFVAAIFVLTAVIALFATNLIDVATDRQAVKAALSGLEEVVRQAVPVMLAEAARQEALDRGINHLPIDEQQLQTAVATVIPSGWIDTQTEAAVDGLYDYLETGDPDAAEVEVDMRPFLESLRGEAGRDVITAVLTNLPPCSEPLPELNLESGQIPGCLPPEVNVDAVAAEVHTAVIQAMEENPQIIGGGGVVRVPLFGEDSPTGLSPERQLELARLHRNFTLARTWAWTLWLLPMACLLLILLLAVRSVPEWGHWWGWPMVITAVIVLFFAILAPAVLTFVTRTAVTPVNADPLTLPLRPFLLDLFNRVVDQWLGQVYLQAGLMLALGVGMIIMAMLVTAVRPASKSRYQ